VAGNTLAVTGSTLSTTGGTTGNTGVATANAGTVTNEFGLVNQQTDAVSGGRTASATGVVVGATSDGDVGVAADAGPPVVTAVDGIAGSSLTVTGNAITAEARNNSANNVAALTGFSTLSTGAGLANGQSSSTNVAATVTGASVTIGSSGLMDPSGNSTFSDSSFTLTGNRSTALAIGSSAANAMTVQAVNLSGNSAATGTASTVSSTTAAAVADFAVASQQRQTGTTTASLQGSNTIDFAKVTTVDSVSTVGGAEVTGGSMTLDGNAMRSVAQALTVGNSLTLVGTSIDANAAIANAQDTDGAVSATQTAAAASDGLKASFGVRAVSIDGTDVSVSGNAILSSAGQNEAFNALNAFGTTVAGSAFTVLNAQAGSGNVTASALPGLIGAQLAMLTDGSLTVSGNSVTSKANVNFASNALTLDAQSTLSGNGRVESTQTSSSTTVEATVGGSSEQVTVGIAPPVPADGSTVDGTAISVSGNALNAQAGGNTSFNALNAAAGSSIGAGISPTFAVLNTQSSSSGLSARIENAQVGAFATVNGGGFAAAPVTVQGNQAIASTYANTASNSIAMSALPGSANAASTSLANSQSNTGSVSAQVIGVVIGTSGAGGTGGGSLTVSGNTVAAAAVGNSAVNSIVGR